MRFRFGAVELDDRRLALTSPEGPVHVEPQVFAVLHHLLLHRERVVPKEELLDTIWGDRFVSESALTSRIKAARRAVGDDGRAQAVIATVHGRGYRFVADVEVVADATARPTVPGLRRAPIGRDDDIAAVVARVRAAPLVTLTGPGGMGKTTVALAAAAVLGADHGDGAVFVDLAALDAGADVVRAVTDAAGIEGEAAASVERVADHLAARDVLVVLDNCEHVLEGAATLADRIVTGGARARVLATSREPLGVPGEHLWPLGPLAPEDGPTLFVERARAVEPRVEWRTDDPAVVALCRLLDDVPLALELAAGQLRRFELAELADRLRDRLGVLGASGAGSSTDTSRHATMAAATDWSYRLLDGDEQALLRQLGTFPAAFDVAAVEGVAPALGPDVLGTFGTLVDKSLVVRRPGAGYRLLETIRLFALDRLDDAGERTAAEERHRTWICGEVAGPSRLDRWMSPRLGARFRIRLDDARHAFARSVALGATGDAVELAVGASFLWRQAIGSVEGARWVADLQPLDLTPRDALWTQLLLADVGQGRGDPRQMFGAAVAADALAADGADPVGAAIAGHYAMMPTLTDPAASGPPLDRAIDLARASGEARLVALLEAFVVVAHTAAGRHDEADAGVHRVDGTASDEGYDRYILNWAAWLAALARLDPVARRWIEAQHEMLDRSGLGRTWLTTYSSSLCDVLDGIDPRPTLGAALALADAEGFGADADGMLVLAYAALRDGEPELAAEHVGTAVAGRFNATVQTVLHRAVVEPLVRARLDGSTIAAAVARGRDRTPAEALAAAGVERPTRRRPPGSPPRPPVPS